MSREWLAVSFFTSTIPWAARAAFCFDKVKLEDGKSSMPLLHRMGNGASRFQVVPPLCTIRHRTTTLDFPLSRFPLRHLSTPPVISSCCYLNTLHIRTMPASRSFFNSSNNDGDGNGNRRWRSIATVVIPPPPDSIHRHDLTRWEREDAEKAWPRWSCRVRADRWSMKPPITRPWFPRVVQAISRLAALVLNCQSHRRPIHRGQWNTRVSGYRSKRTKPQEGKLADLISSFIINIPLSKE